MIMNLIIENYTRKQFHEVSLFLQDLYVNNYSRFFITPERFENAVLGMDENASIIRKENSIVGLIVFESNDVLISYTGTPVAEYILKYLRDEKGNDIRIIVPNNNHELIKSLKKMRFKDQGIYSWQRILSNDVITQKVELHPDYSLSTVTHDDLEDIAEAVRTVFGHKFFSKKTLEEICSCSFYKPDLDFIIRHNNGKLAAFCTFRIDLYCNIITLEPMGVVPDHRNRGLAKYMLLEGINRVKSYNPSLITISGAANSVAANALYDSTGFTRKIPEHSWIFEN